MPGFRLESGLKSVFNMRMDNHLVTFADGARRLEISERTLRRWSNEGLVDRYWWGPPPGARGPRVSLEQLRSIRGDPIEALDGTRAFQINTPRRGFVTITEIDTATTSTAVALWDATIKLAAAHPDGLLVLTAGNIGKITRNTKGIWTYGPCSRCDLHAAGVDGTIAWESAANTLLGQ